MHLKDENMALLVLLWVLIMWMVMFYILTRSYQKLSVGGFHFEGEVELSLPNLCSK